MECLRFDSTSLESRKEIVNNLMCKRVFLALSSLILRKYGILYL